MEFKVNGVKQDYAMKLGEGGEAFFVFETTDEIPASLQTSPLVSPASSPTVTSDDLAPSLQEPEYLDLDRMNGDAVSEGAKTPPGIPLSRQGRATTDFGMAHSEYLFRALAQLPIQEQSLRYRAHRTIQV